MMNTRYQVILSGGVRDLDAGVTVPFDQSSPDWQAYRAWLKDGNTPLPPDAPAPPPAPTPEELRATAKLARAESVASIKVTTAAGNVFDGDETSQGRMSRAVIALSTGLAPSVTWVLADNSVIEATADELTEALVLAGQAQAAIWVIN